MLFTHYLLDKNGNETELRCHTDITPIFDGFLITELFGIDKGREYIQSKITSLKDGKEHCLPIRDARVLHISSDLTCSYYTESPTGNESSFLTGIWSLKENRALISRGKGFLYPFFMDEHIYPHTDPEGSHLRLLTDGDRVLWDCGNLEGGKCNRFCWDEAPVFVVSRGKEDRHRYAVDARTGERVGPTFSSIGNLRGGIRYIRTSEGRDCIVDKDWNEMFELPLSPNWLDAGEMTGTSQLQFSPDCNRMALIDARDRMYLLDGSGNMIIPPGKHRFIQTVGESRLLVSKGWHHALADENGELITDYIFRSSSIGINRSFRDGLLPIEKTAGKRKTYYGVLCGVIDTDGNEVIPFVYDSISDFHTGYAVADKEIRRRR